MSKDKQKPRRRRSRRRTELIKAAIIVVLIGLVLRIFIFRPFCAPDKAMENALYAGDFLLTSQLAYRSGTPQPGDLIIFQHPFKIDETASGRVVATEGQTVDIINKVVYVDGKEMIEPWQMKHTDERIISDSYSYRDNIGPVQVPGHTVYVLCDNRDEGEDSRHFGPINIDNIKGKGLFVYWSWHPDPNAPKMESPYIIPAISNLFYNLFHFPTRVGWDRLGASPN